jgi:hypothetical protein
MPVGHPGDVPDVDRFEGILGIGFSVVTTVSDDKWRGGGRHVGPGGVSPRVSNQG